MESYLNFELDLSSCPVLYYIMTRGDTAKYDGFKSTSTSVIQYIILHYMESYLNFELDLSSTASFMEQTYLHSLGEQVAVGLYYILTGSCPSQTKP